MKLLHQSYIKNGEGEVKLVPEECACCACWFVGEWDWDDGGGVAGAVSV